MTELFVSESVLLSCCFLEIAVFCFQLCTGIKLFIISSINFQKWKTFKCKTVLGLPDLSVTGRTMWTSVTPTPCKHAYFWKCILKVYFYVRGYYLHRFGNDPIFWWNKPFWGKLLFLIFSLKSVLYDVWCKKAPAFLGFCTGYLLPSFYLSVYILATSLIYRQV